MLMDNQLKAFVLCVEHQTLNAYVWYTCLLLFIQVQKKKNSSNIKGCITIPTERSSNKHSQPMQQLYAANGVLENQSVCYSRHGIANSMLGSMQRL